MFGKKTLEKNPKCNAGVDGKGMWSNSHGPCRRGTACTKNVPTPPVTPAKHKKPLLGGLLQLFCIFPGPLLLHGGGGVGGEGGGGGWGVCPVTCMWYVAQPKHCMVCLPNCSSFIPLFLISLFKLLYSTFYLLLFIHIVTFRFSNTSLCVQQFTNASFLCMCNMLRLYISILSHQSFLNLCSKPSSTISLNDKKSNWL